MSIWIQLTINFPKENDIDRALSPNFDDFAGQESILENLKIFVLQKKEEKL